MLNLTCTLYRINAVQRKERPHEVIPLPDPRRVYFGAGNAARALHLRHHERGQGTDLYWLMEGNMTVFGFGRSNLESYLSEVPAAFTVGFFETREHGRVETFLGGLFEPLDGAAEPGGQPG